MKYFLLLSIIILNSCFIEHYYVIDNSDSKYDISVLKDDDIDLHFYVRSNFYQRFIFESNKSFLENNYYPRLKHGTIQIHFREEKENAILIKELKVEFFRIVKNDTIYFKNGNFSVNLSGYTDKVVNCQIKECDCITPNQHCNYYVNETLPLDSGIFNYYYYSNRQPFEPSLLFLVTYPDTVDCKKCKLLLKLDIELTAKGRAKSLHKLFELNQIKKKRLSFGTI